MTTVQEIFDYLNDLYPEALRCEWDNDGMMLSHDPDGTAERVLCTLDVTDDVIDEATELGCRLIVSHHPLIFHPMRAVTPDDPVGRRVIRLLRAGISVLSFHTRFDTVFGGMNDLLAGRLGLSGTVPFGCEGETVGRIGTLEKPMNFDSFAAFVRHVLRCESFRVVSPQRTVRRVAVVGGDGKDFFRAAAAAGADAFVTGEMSHDAMLDADALGLDVIAAGHAETERISAEAFAVAISERFADVDAFVSESRDVSYMM